MFVHSTNQKGNIAELAIATEAARLGLSVLKPLTEHEPYDLVIEIGGRLLRVQCKWARRQGDVVLVKLTRSRRNADGFVQGYYSADEVDAIAAYCGELDRCFLIPIELVAGQASIQLRLVAPRNGQRAALHFADEYRFGAVAQLAERRYGISKVGGSNPPSSTSEDGTLAATIKEVGAHEFRNHFGYYMEQAAAGSEILIRRRGRPFARLGPPGSTPSRPIQESES